MLDILFRARVFDLTGVLIIFSFLLFQKKEHINFKASFKLKLNCLVRLYVGALENSFQLICFISRAK